MVSIPKIKVSSIKKKEGHNLSSNYSGTTNFGFVFPSFAREMMPKAKFNMKVKSTILNAPMPVPTFGEMYLNHKHVFVPYVDVCPQYQSFLTAQSYTLPSGTSYVPTELPYLDLPLIAQWCLSYFADFTVYKRNKELPSSDYEQRTAYEPILFENGYVQDDLDDFKDLFNVIWKPQSGSNYFYGKAISSSTTNNNKADTVDFDDAFKMMPLAPINRDGYGRSPNSLCGRWLAGDFAFSGDREMSTSSDWWSFNGSEVIEGVDISTNGMWKPSQGYVDILTADYVSLFGPTSGLSEYAIAFKLRSTGKHLFNILMGLGYQFAPNLEDQIEPTNWLKVFAFYKSWFNIYRPKRQLSFTQTNCYKLIKMCETADANSTLYPSAYDMADVLKEFLWDLSTEPYYYLPQDYFGMSVLTPNPDYTEDGGNLLPTYVGSFVPNEQSSASLSSISVNESGNPSVIISQLPASLSPAVQKIALGILKHINKNTIVGKDIADFIKVHFGISLDTSHDLDKVYVIGEVNEDIDISPVMSMAQTTDGDNGDDLGSYAGRGYGESKQGNEFEFENTKDTHGVWITLSCIIPKSGYYQGILKENRSLKRFDFPQSDFDALGYEVLSRSEVSADYPVCTSTFNPHTYSGFDRKKGFGFVPRLSGFKIGRDVVAGEMALRSGVSQFDGYHLERKIPYERISVQSLYDSEGNMKVLTAMNAPAYVPNVVHDEFRRVDPTDNLGNLNRCFYSESVNDDHFIVHFKFNVDAWLPLMSLSDSFDTQQSDSDDVNIVHS